MVSLLRHVETPACFLLVTEYCNGGNLRTYLKRHCLDGGLPETTIRHFFRQIGKFRICFLHCLEAPFSRWS